MAPGVDQIGLRRIDGGMLLRLVAHQNPHHRQRQDQRQDAERVELPAPSDRHDQAGDDETGEHRPDHGADPPIGCRLAALAQREPVGDQCQRDRIAGRFADAQADARGEQHAVAVRKARPETGERPDDEARHNGVTRPVTGHRPAPDRRGEAVGDEQAADQPAEQFGLAGKLHLVEEFRIGDDKRDIALVEHGHDPEHQERRRDVGPAHPRGGGYGGGIARKSLRNRDGHAILPRTQRAFWIFAMQRRTTCASFSNCCPRMKTCQRSAMEERGAENPMRRPIRPRPSATPPKFSSLFCGWG